MPMMNPVFSLSDDEKFLFIWPTLLHDSHVEFNRPSRRNADDTVPEPVRQWNLKA
jgi:hypothetical protein